MNKKFLVLIALLFVACVGIVAAEDATLGDCTFTIPEGFEIVQSTDSMIMMQQDDDHVIGVMIPEEVKNSEDAKTYLENQGYEFIAEETYNADGKEVQQQNYESDGYAVMTYVLPAGSNQCIVTYTIPSDEAAPEGTDNPVTTILNSIHE